MSLSFSSAPGNWFNVLGKCGLLLKQLRTYQNSQRTNMIDAAAGLVAQLNSNPDIQAGVGNGYLGVLGSAEAAGSMAKTVAEQTLNRLIFNDNPRISQTLQGLNTDASLRELIRQMRVAGASVLAMTVTANPAAVSGQPGPHFTGNGNGVVNSSVRRPLDGQVMENSFAETLLLTCTGDSYLGGATAGNESLSVTGVGQQTDVFAFNWPLGSNARSNLNAIGVTDNGGGNLLTNSGYETWSGNTPGSHVIDFGASLIFKETSVVYDTAPSSALRLQGDGSTLTQWRQQFGVSTGTLGSLSPLTQYSFCIFARRDAVAAGSGVLAVELVDGNGAVINDQNGTPNQFTVNLTALATNYAGFTGVIRTPEILPAQQWIRFRLTAGNPLTTGRSVYLDHGSLGQFTQIYTSGPSLAVHSGSIPFTVNDFATVPVTNSRGAGGTLDTFQTLMTRLFSQMISQELLLPSASPPSVSDSALIA